MSNSSDIPTTMRAIYTDEYGPPKEVLELKTIEVPTLKPGHVLIRVRASSPHAGDWHLIRGTPWFIRLMFGGIRKPTVHIPGTDICGNIQSIADDVTDFNIGDQVFGDLSECGFGAFADYVIAPVSSIVKIPHNVSVQQAAVSGVSALAALQVIREGLKDKQKDEKTNILINGASGGVGTFAIQMAKHFGGRHTEVWAVCHKKKADVLRKLGADFIVDYTEQDVIDLDVKFDLIVDTACFQSPGRYTKILNNNGKILVVGGATSRFLQMIVLSPWLSITKSLDARFFESKPNKEDLLLIADLLSKGVVTPHIDRRFTLDQVPDAIAYIEGRNVTGKVVIVL